eukprot:scaffold359282_cov51-Prasinocladus_malaysianus.AAC.1
MKQHTSRAAITWRIDEGAPAVVAASAGYLPLLGYHLLAGQQSAIYRIIEMTQTWVIGDSFKYNARGSCRQDEAYYCPPYCMISEGTSARLYIFRVADSHHPAVHAARALVGRDKRLSQSIDPRSEQHHANH